MKFFGLCILMFAQIALMSLAHAAPLIGRLFSSPAERSALNYLRQTKKAMITTPLEMPIQRAEPAPVILPGAINIQGYVKRSDGKQGTVWINNKAIQENSSNKDVQVGSLPKNGNRIPIKLSANGKRLTLKAGQVYDPENNRISEARSHAAQGDSGTIDGSIGDAER